jgi:hypothetical protein
LPSIRYTGKTRASGCSVEPSVALSLPRVVIDHGYNNLQHLEDPNLPNNLLSHVIDASATPRQELVMSSSYKRGEVCGEGNCESERWFDNLNGTQSCENGHVRALFSNDNDDDYRNIGDTTTRKKERIKRQSRCTSPFTLSPKLSIDSLWLMNLFTVPTGRKQRNLLMLCHQWILRKQVWWLIHEKHLPQELEVLISITAEKSPLLIH